MTLSQDNCLTSASDNVPSQRGDFRTETDLVGRIIRYLSGRKTPWGRVQILTEWDYRSGITDILVRTNRKEVIAFEAKLSDWRRAIYQAYRNTTFAGRSYVVLPERVASRAEKNREVFGNYGVGLCACGDRELSVLIEAHNSPPLMEWLTKRAHATFDAHIPALNLKVREVLCDPLRDATALLASLPNIRAVTRPEPPIDPYTPKKRHTAGDQPSAFEQTSPPLWEHEE